MKLSLSCIIAFLVPYFATAQIGSGTVVAYAFTQHKFVIAADSRAVYDDSPPLDDRCKVAAFGHQFVFATTGFAEFPGDSRIGAWTNIREAQRSIQQAILPSVASIADIWASDLQAKWISLRAIDPATVETAAEYGKGLITTGIFAEAAHGTISVAFRELRWINDSIEVGQFDCPFGHPCVSGVTDFVFQVDAAQPMTVSPSLLSTYSHDLLYVYRLADLVIAYVAPIQTKRGPVKPVAPPIDAMEMLGNGTIQWLNQKRQCAEK